MLPLKVHVYRDNAGNDWTNLKQIDVEDVIIIINDLFRNTNSGIQFYITEIDFENNENWRTGIDTQAELFAFFALRRADGELNLHLLDHADIDADGFAITPFIPSTQISNIGAIKWSCFTATQSGDLDYIAKVAAHELGHTLGLLHTHHPGRLLSLASNSDNATISNSCYQEMRDRNHENNFAPFNNEWCRLTNGDLSCEINGDFLCDTEADPNVSSDLVNNGVTSVTDISPCTYFNNSTNADYDADNLGGTWTPPITNIMSYSHTTCQDEFTPMQTGAMWHYIE
mgnify:CR=1 FL=1